MNATYVVHAKIGFTRTSYWLGEDGQWHQDFAKAVVFRDIHTACRAAKEQMNCEVRCVEWL